MNHYESECSAECESHHIRLPEYELLVALDRRRRQEWRAGAASAPSRECGTIIGPKNECICVQGPRKRLLRGCKKFLPALA